MRIFVAIMGGFLVLVPVMALAQGEALYAEGKEQWERQVWPGAYVPLREFRLLNYGRRPDVDYMLGTSGCRIDGLRIWGGNMLDAMLYAYPLTAESRAVVRHELSVCRGSMEEARGDDTLRLALIDWPPAGMTAVFKTYYWSDDTQPVASYPMRRIDIYPREHFAARLVPLEDKDAALAKAAELSPSGNAAITDRLVVISESHHSPEELERLAASLDGYVAFLQREYGIGDLKSYVTIYLVSHSEQLRQRARELHGLDVSGATLGYAYADDLSLVAYVPGIAAGTVLHELFHLLVRSDFGNIPQWLDEGIASLYEVSAADGERYWGVDNWRGEVLHRLWDDQKPTLEELIRSEWYLLDDPSQAASIAEADSPEDLSFGEEDSARQAAMMATARYFALYLQENNLLRAVFEAMRSSDPAMIKDHEIDPRDHAVAVVEASLGGRSLSEVDAAFSDWFLGGGPAAAARPADAVVRIDKAEPARTYAANTRVNIRRGPGVDFSRIGGLGIGDPVTVLRIENGWAEIRLQNGGSGYVSEVYLTPLQ